MGVQDLSRSALTFFPAPSDTELTLSPDRSDTKLKGMQEGTVKISEPAPGVDQEAKTDVSCTAEVRDQIGELHGIVESQYLALEARAAEAAEAQARISQLEDYIRSTGDRTGVNSLKTVRQQDVEVEARQYLLSRVQFWQNRADETKRQLTDELDVLEFENTKLSDTAKAAEGRATEAEALKEHLEAEVKALNTRLNEPQAAGDRECEFVDQLSRSQEEVAKQVVDLKNQLSLSEETAADLEMRLSESVEDTSFWEEMCHKSSGDAADWLKQLKETIYSNTNLHAMIVAGSDRERELQSQIEKLQAADRESNEIWLKCEEEIGELNNELALAEAQGLAATERTKQAEFETYEAVRLASEWHRLVLEIRQALGSNALPHTLPSQVRALCTQNALLNRGMDIVASSFQDITDRLDEATGAAAAENVVRVVSES
ncbi:MAG: hypothetical protein Q9200_004457 [Gallowayella weberi]